jgi:hypothetical protein
VAIKQVLEAALYSFRCVELSSLRRAQPRASAPDTTLIRHGHRNDECTRSLAVRQCLAGPAPRESVQQAECSAKNIFALPAREGGGSPSSSLGFFISLVRARENALSSGQGRSRVDGNFFPLAARPRGPLRGQARACVKRAHYCSVRSSIAPTVSDPPQLGPVRETAIIEPPLLPTIPLPVKCVLGQKPTPASDRRSMASASPV